jgi:glycosyltransferase involved in cell wall biosynthesis
MTDQILESDEKAILGHAGSFGSRCAAYVIPAFQAQQELEDTLRSLDDSNVPSFVIVVDDGSPIPLKVPEHYSTISVHLFRLNKNQGIVAALNIGLQIALDAGFEFIARIDAGDYAFPRRLALQIEYLRNHPNCMLVGCDTDVWNEDGTYCFTITPPRNPQILRRALHERAWLLGPTVMYRASVLREIGLYSDEFIAAEDYEMFIRIAQRHEIGVVPETLLTYIVRKDSVSSTKMRPQSMSRLRIQIRYFHWADWICYYGIFRTVGILLIPRNLKRLLKLKFLYKRRTSVKPITHLRAPLA